jgi:hypothetical protein
MENPERPVCAHTPCQCLAGEDSSYCSTWCESAALAARQEDGCECGHAACEQRSFQPRFTVT